ncbi:hypothetical protein CAPI_08155 [Corynebacterium capitovis DSM 44611]|uniref:DUF3180 domain-containing protein n=1 Tax=Corynebacterium capitovis TaxID=131081 RepID=UPI00037B6BB4|nr:DUF3180 domain-containing protein [Corynebacterium capitovis]WKD58158.1 hypothetical protein CAPI_08155 [Corynebacterium capitovis DSM 44611]
MTRTPLAGLAGLGGFCAAAAFILIRRFYGAIAGIDVTLSLPLWIVAAVCLFSAYMVRKRREEGKVGLDRSQLNPLMAANFMLMGKASAWSGAVCGGVFAGVLVYVAPRVSALLAAEADLPGAVSGTFGGLALAVAGVVLERSCEVSPPSEGEAVQ